MLIPFLLVLSLITCGGTIDRAFTDDDHNYQFNSSYIPQMLNQSRCEQDIRIKDLMAKDSLT
jgi:hypothetical protein